MQYAILIDFGSTFTKLTCVHLGEQKIVLTDQFPSTVRSDAGIGLHQCFEAARREIGAEGVARALKLSSSSAAGGLRMAVIGLTPSLSIAAGKNAAYGAGAKIMKNFFGAMTAADISQLEAAGVEIVLLCGGYEHGNRSLVLHNAELLSKSRLLAPIIYAGNSEAARDVRRLLAAGNKECFLVENIIPAIGVLNTAPTEAVIRNLFMKRITNMKGMGAVQAEIGEILMPTPAAVLAAGTLLSRGTDQTAGLGPLLLLDVGGATTDVYSFVENTGYLGAKRVGVEEPYAKRTVEGDMGMRESAACLLDEVGAETLAKQAGLSVVALEKAIENRMTNTGLLADTEAELRLDRAIAGEAVAISVRRHAGYVERVYSNGGHQVQRGKNLTEIRTVIGTGGVIVRGGAADGILRRALLSDPREEFRLLPREMQTSVDRAYVLYAAGLLRSYDEETALAIMKASICR
ncbi:MAG: glutamate mutase L [Oscillospiraceae bacterium]